MVDLVQLPHHLLPHGHGDDDPGLPGGRVIVQDSPRWQASGGAGECAGVDQGFDVLAGLLDGSKLVQRAEGDGVELLKHISGQGVGDGVVRAGDVLYV